MPSPAFLDAVPRALDSDDAVRATGNLNHSLDDRLHPFDPFTSLTLNTLHSTEWEGFCPEPTRSRFSAVAVGWSLGRVVTARSSRQCIEQPAQLLGGSRPEQRH